MPPRGGVPGFVKVPDERTLLVPDAPGNNRLDSLENIVATGRAGLLFLVPGVDESLRVNGSAVLSRAAGEALEIYGALREGRQPQLASPCLGPDEPHLAEPRLRVARWCRQSSSSVRQALEIGNPSAARLPCLLAPRRRAGRQPRSGLPGRPGVSAPQEYGARPAQEVEPRPQQGLV